jgi:hypothetical protein
MSLHTAIAELQTLQSAYESIEEMQAKTEKLRAEIKRLQGNVDALKREFAEVNRNREQVIGQARGGH